MIVEKPINEIKTGHYIVDIVKQSGNFSLKNAGHVKSDAIVIHLQHKGIITVFN